MFSMIVNEIKYRMTSFSLSALAVALAAVSRLFTDAVAVDFDRQTRSIYISLTTVNAILSGPEQFCSLPMTVLWPAKQNCEF